MLAVAKRVRQEKILHNQNSGGDEMSKKGFLTIMVAVIAGFTGGLLSGHLPLAQAKNQVDFYADSLSARIVRLVNSKGDVLAVLGAEKDSLPLVVLRDAQGRDRMALRMTQAGPELILSDKDENLRAKLQVADDGLPGLFFLDQHNKNRFSSMLTSAGNPMLLMNASDGQGRFLLDVNDSGKAKLLLTGAQGKPQAAMTVHEVFGPGVFLMDPAGEISKIYGPHGIVDAVKAPQDPTSRSLR